MKTRRNKPAEGAAFEERYPALMSLIQHRGRVEIGRPEYGPSRAFITAFDFGGWAWEGKPAYASMTQAFDDAEQAVRRFLVEKGAANEKSLPIGAPRSTVSKSPRRPGT